MIGSAKVDRPPIGPGAGAPLPDDLFAKMLAARRFQAGLFLLRQIEFATFDLRLQPGRQLVPAQREILRIVTEKAACFIARIAGTENENSPHRGGLF